jgi:hypothetical protein
LTILVFVPGCVVAAWWQINRAAGGNQLSYLYSVLWPAFAILSVYFWWMLIHTDYESAGLKGMLRQQEAAAQETGARVAGGGAGSGGNADVAGATAPPTATAATATVGAVEADATHDVDDPELAAYNARLAELAAQGPKTWRARESVVVRREQ